MDVKQPDSVETFDKAVALSRVGGDIELLKEIAVLFLEDYPRSLTDLRDAVHARFQAGAAVKLEAHGEKAKADRSLADLPQELIRGDLLGHTVILEQSMNIVKRFFALLHP